MQIILAIMLYLQLIFSPGTYQQSYINKVYEENQVEIEAVQNDPKQMDIVNQEYLPKTDQIIIVDDGVNSAF